MKIDLLSSNDEKSALDNGSEELSARQHVANGIGYHWIYTTWVDRLVEFPQLDSLRTTARFPVSLSLFCSYSSSLARPLAIYYIGEGRISSSGVRCTAWICPWIARLSGFSWWCRYLWFVDCFCSLNAHSWLVSPTFSSTDHRSPLFPFLSQSCSERCWTRIGTSLGHVLKHFVLCVVIWGNINSREFIS